MPLGQACSGRRRRRPRGRRDARQARSAPGARFCSGRRRSRQAGAVIPSRPRPGAAYPDEVGSCHRSWLQPRLQSSLERRLLLVRQGDSKNPFLDCRRFVRKRPQPSPARMKLAFPNRRASDRLLSVSSLPSPAQIVCGSRADRTPPNNRRTCTGRNFPVDVITRSASRRAE